MSRATASLARPPGPALLPYAPSVGEARARRPFAADLARRTLLLGGLGAPYDDLLAATLRAAGLDACTLGAMDLDAHERGTRVLSRSPCAPLLFTTGAVLRAARALPAGRPALVLGVGSCGPCRFTLFAETWRRALAGAGASSVEVLALDQDPLALTALLGTEGAEAALDALAVGDALAEVVRRVRPHLVQPDAIDEAHEGALGRVVRRIEAGHPPLAALAPERGFHARLPRAAPAPLGRIAIVGEPWSLHVDGAPQLNLARVLARAGVEVEIPPLSTWLALRAWEARGPRWGARSAAPDEEGARALAARIETTLERASATLGLHGLDVPDHDELAALAAPWLPPDVRGGYGHVEVALALRAQRAHRAHAVVSIKSFGCIPSSGLSDAIVPVALAAGSPPLPFLALEVAADGEAARESRLMLRASGARRAAERELAEARRRAPDAPLPVIDPLAAHGGPGPRPYACTLACAVAEGRRRAS